MQSWGLTDKGCVRKMNQDAYEIRQLDRKKSWKHQYQSA